MILSKYDKILIFVNDGGMYVGVILFTSTLNFVQRIKIKKKKSLMDTTTQPSELPKLKRQYQRLERM